uniref:Related to transforming protein rho n=1 Tax=Neurospora crassa TaxID=5141 RepID=Q8NIT3_NEUCS|nr:related to transforming protein rho [Neurospora crassa]
MVRSPTPSIPLRMVGGHPLPANGMRPPPSPSYESAPYSFKLRVPPRLCPARQLDSSPATNTGGVQSARYQPHSPFPHPSTSEVHHTISRADRAPSRPHRDYHPNREFETNIPGLDLREVQHIKTRTKAPSSGVQNHHHQSQRHIHSYSRSHRPCDNIDHKIKDPVPMYGVALVDDRGGVEFLATDRMDDWLAGVENDDFIIYEDPVEHGPDKNDTELSGAEPQTDESGLASTVVRYAMMEIEDGGDSDKENQNDAPKYRRIRKPTPIKPTILKEIKLNQVKTEIVKEDDAKTIWPKVDDSMLSVLKRRSIKRHAVRPYLAQHYNVDEVAANTQQAYQHSQAWLVQDEPEEYQKQPCFQASRHSICRHSGGVEPTELLVVGAWLRKVALRLRLFWTGEKDQDLPEFVEHSPITDHQIPTAPSSHATDYHSFSIIADDGKLVTIELWDFPGNIANERTTQLASNFFQAAIICYSVEDVKNIPSICDTWKPKLDRSLIDCPRFLLGLKKDLRPAFPPLGLSFLPRKEPVMADMGRSAAYHSRVAGYGECSAKTGENVDDAFRGIVNFTLSHMRKKEIGIAHGKRRDKAKETVKDAGKVMVDALCGFPNGPTPGRAWSRHL